MWNSLSNIKHYENLLNRKDLEGYELTTNDVNFQKICRTCLRDAPDTNNLMNDFEIGAINFSFDGRVLKLIDMLSESVGTEIQETDRLPNQLCNNCIQNVSGAYFFRLQCKRARDMLLRLDEALHSSTDDVTIEENSTPEKLEQELFEKSIESPHTEPADHKSNENDVDSETEIVKNSENEMHIEFEGIKYEIDSETFDMGDDVISEDYEYVSETEKIGCDTGERGTKLENIEIEIVSTKKKLVKKSERNSFQCVDCDEGFSKQKFLNEHMRDVHPESKGFRCDTCGSRFTKLHSLKRHLKIHQGAEQKDKFCSYCDKAFIRTDDLTRHIRIHTGERPYACSICPKRYKQSSELKEHTLTHSKEKVFVCTICGKLLQTRNGHYVHMRTHMGIKKHVCRFCSNGYVTSSELSSHIRHIHEKQKPFACTVTGCQRAFASKVSLEIHLRCHSGTRPFQCSYCGKRLATNSSLTEHLRSHTGDSKYMCDICHQQFVTSQSLKRHLTHHSSESFDGHLILACDACGQCFSHSGELDRHVCKGQHDEDDSFDTQVTLEQDVIMEEGDKDVEEFDEDKVEI